jgi:hypothetical protein
LGGKYLYIRLYEEDVVGNATYSEVQKRLIVRVNSAPMAPSSPAPANGATNVPLEVVLAWAGGDPDFSDTVAYDVYFGTVSPPVDKVSESQLSTSYSPSFLAYGTTYYWKVVARDNHGAETEGPVWGFTTLSNNTPVADSKNVATSENTPVGVTLSGSDTETSAANLVFLVVIQPDHGTLSGTPPNLTYTPNPDYNGSDSFTYTVTDRGAPDNCGTPGPACAEAKTSAPATVSITISPINDPPVADAGPDQNVLTGQPVTLNGSKSFDPERAMITFLWWFVEVPAGSGVIDASLSDVASAKPVFTPNMNGTYKLRLIVNDGFQDSIPDEVMLNATTPNVAPNANAGPDQNVATGVEVNLDGTDSYDSDGQSLSFLWSLESKPPASTLTEAGIEGKTTPNPSFAPDVEGVYRFRLVVNDGFTDSDPDTVEIHAFSATGNVPPNARAGKDQRAKVNTLVVLDGSMSNDPDDGPAEMMAFQWRFKSVPSGSVLLDRDLLDRDQVSASFVPDIAGAYTVELQVYDGLDTDTDEVTIQAYSTNVPPNARAGQDRKVDPGDEVILDGTMSFDPDEGPGPLTYESRFVFLPSGSALTDGSLADANTARPKFTPDVVGAYVIEMVVSDGEETDFDHVMVVAMTEPWLEVTPAEGTVGTEFTLTGHHYAFGSSKGKLLIGKNALTVASWGNESILTRLTKPNPPGTYDIKILPKKPKGGAQQTMWEPRCFTVKVPEVYEVGPVPGGQGNRVTGKFFGTKKGKIYLGDLACKVKTWTMNPDTNESEATFLLPKGVTSGTFMLNVANMVGRGIMEVSLP